jgi:hypothetical protein
MIKKWTWFIITLTSYTMLNIGILTTMYGVYPPMWMFINQTNSEMVYSGVGVTCAGIVGSIISVLMLVN